MTWQSPPSIFEIASLRDFEIEVALLAKTANLDGYEFMRKVFFILICVFILFLTEFFLFNMGGRWFMPNLLLLLIIYVNFTFGIRYSILSAVLAGILKDSFSIDIFGLNIFSFVVCAYMVTVLKKYLHYEILRRSKLSLVFSITMIHVVTSFCLAMMFGEVHGIYSLKFVLVPEILTTLIISSFIFTQLRKCASKLFV